MIKGLLVRNTNHFNKEKVVSADEDVGEETNFLLPVKSKKPTTRLLKPLLEVLGEEGAGVVKEEGVLKDQMSNATIVINMGTTPGNVARQRMTKQT